VAEAIFFVGGAGVGDIGIGERRRCCSLGRSEGVREVIGESLAYIYVKLFFSPE
jgi:hypothetical protein